MYVSIDNDVCTVCINRITMYVCTVWITMYVCTVCINRITMYVCTVCINRITMYVCMYVSIDNDVCAVVFVPISSMCYSIR